MSKKRVLCYYEIALKLLHFSAVSLFLPSFRLSICYKNYPVFSICKLSPSDNIMHLLQIDGKRIRGIKHICLAMNCNQAYNMTIDVSLHGRLISLCLQRIAESGENI